MKIVCISDTHLAQPQLPEGDVLVHAGDMTFRGTASETAAILKWFTSLQGRYRKIIAVPGNHDFWEFEMPAVAKLFLEAGVDILNDSGLTFDGVSFWGSPVQPWFHNFAFNRFRGSDIKKHWDLIPSRTDVLITHGPPLGILDMTDRGEAVGCRELREKIREVRPKLHVFGHIHEGYGTHTEDGTVFVNASIMDLAYRPVNAPVVVEI